MKQIIWIFGESATGKKTFIENILSNKDDIRKMFDFNTDKIVALTRTILSYKNEQLETIDRHTAILNGISEFINSNEEILLIKGQTNDMEFVENNTEKRGTLIKSVEMFSNVQKSIILLEISDTDLLYDRMTHKDWWLSNPEYYFNWLPRSSWDNKTLEHRNKVLSFEKYGFDIQIVDTTDGYKKIERSDNYGESNCIRR